MLKKINQEQEGLLLILYCFRNHLDNPEIWNRVNQALFKLINETECTGEEDLKDFTETTKLLSQEEFLTLIEEALAKLDDENLSYEKLSLKHLLETPSDELAFPIACKSPIFIKTCQSYFPNAKSFTTIEYCLFSSTQSYLIDLNSGSAKTLTNLIDFLKQTLKKTISEELSEATESSEEIQTTSDEETSSDEEASSCEETSSCEERASRKESQNEIMESTKPLNYLTDSIQQKTKIEKRPPPISFFNRELNNQSNTSSEQAIQNDF